MVTLPPQRGQTAKFQQFRSNGIPDASRQASSSAALLCTSSSNFIGKPSLPVGPAHIRADHGAPIDDGPPVGRHSQLCPELRETYC